MVYLLHFDKPLCHARHYIGYTENLDKRILQHRSGNGHARLMEVIYELGIGFRIARVWFGEDRHFERMLKNQKNAPRLCPYCNKRISHMLYQPELFNQVIDMPPGWWDTIDEIPY